MLIKNYLNKLLEGYRMQNIEEPKSFNRVKRVFTINKLVENIYNEILERNNIKHDNPSNTREAISEEETGIGAGIKFQRLRRVTGYLSGRGIDGMNNAKQAEVADRLIHSTNM